MNIITIKKISDLNKIIDTRLYITGNKANLQKEINCNMWCLIFTKDSIQKITIQDLHNFFSLLLASKKKQLSTKKPLFQAYFYIWFDKQALQLRFNCISNTNNTLPFGCTVMLVDSPREIFNDCLSTTGNFFKNGDTIEFFNSIKESEEAKEEKFVLSVFVERINCD